MLVALVAFITLLIVGVYLQELTWKHVITFIALALAGLVALFLLDIHPLAYAAVLVVLDIIMILLIFKGDIRLR